MNTCENDSILTETIYPKSDYVEEFNYDGERVYNTLKSDHSPGVTVTRIIQCATCQAQKAKADVDNPTWSLTNGTRISLKTLKRSEDVPTLREWTGDQNRLAKQLGLKVKLNVTCSKCGSLSKVRNDKNRNPLCSKCYKKYRKEYMRDLMRRIRAQP